jgi:hypothetical protein
MVIGDFDIERPLDILWPLETHTPLFVNTDAVLPVAISMQRLKATAWQKHQIFKAGCHFENVQPTLGLIFESLELLYAFACRKSRRTPVAVFGLRLEREFMHIINITRMTQYVKRQSFSGT